MGSVQWTSKEVHLREGIPVLSWHFKNFTQQFHICALWCRFRCTSKNSSSLLSNQDCLRSQCSTASSDKCFSFYPWIACLEWNITGLQNWTPREHFATLEWNYFIIIQQNQLLQYKPTPPHLHHTSTHTLHTHPNLPRRAKLWELYWNQCKPLEAHTLFII